MNDVTMKKVNWISRIAAFFIIGMILIIHGLPGTMSIAKDITYSSWVRGSSSDKGDFTGGDPLVNADENAGVEEYKGEIQAAAEAEKNEDVPSLEKLLSEIPKGIGSAISSGLKSFDGIDVSVTGIVMGSVTATRSFFVFDLTDQNIFGMAGAILYILTRTIAIAVIFLAALYKVVRSIWNGNARAGQIFKDSLITFIVSIVAIYVMPLVVDWVCSARDAMIVVMYNQEASLMGSDATAAIANGLEVQYLKEWETRRSFVNAVVYLVVCCLPIYYATCYIKVAVTQLILFGVYPLFETMGVLDGKKSTSTWITTFITNCFVPVLDCTLLLVPSVICALIRGMLTEPVKFDASLIKALFVCTMFYAVIPTRNMILGMLGNNFTQNMGAGTGLMGALKAAGRTALGLAGLGLGAAKALGGAAKDKIQNDSDEKKAQENALSSDRAIGGESKVNDKSDSSGIGGASKGEDKGRGNADLFENLNDGKGHEDTPNQKAGEDGSSGADSKSKGGESGGSPIVASDSEKVASDSEKGSNTIEMAEEVGGGAGTGSGAGNEDGSEGSGGTSGESGSAESVTGFSGSGGSYASGGSEESSLEAVGSIDGNGTLADDIRDNSYVDLANGVDHTNFNMARAENLHEMESLQQESANLETSNSELMMRNAELNEQMRSDNKENQRLNEEDRSLKAEELRLRADEASLKEQNEKLMKLEDEFGAGAKVTTKERLENPESDTPFPNMPRPVHHDLARERKELDAKMAENKAALKKNGEEQERNKADRAAVVSRLQKQDSVRAEIQDNNAKMAQNTARQQMVNAQLKQDALKEKKYAGQMENTGRSGKTYDNAQDFARDLKTAANLNKVVSYKDFTDRKYDGVLSDAQRIQFQRRAETKQLQAKIGSYALQAGKVAAVGGATAMGMAIASGSGNAGEVASMGGIAQNIHPTTEVPGKGSSHGGGDGGYNYTPSKEYKQRTKQNAKIKAQPQIQAQKEQKRQARKDDYGHPVGRARNTRTVVSGNDNVTPISQYTAQGQQTTQQNGGQTQQSGGQQNNSSQQNNNQNNHRYDTNEQSKRREDSSRARAEMKTNNYSDTGPQPKPNGGGVDNWWGSKFGWTEYDRDALTVIRGELPEPVRTGRVSPENYVGHYLDKEMDKRGEDNVSYALLNGGMRYVVDDGHGYFSPMDSKMFEEFYHYSSKLVDSSESDWRKLEHANGGSLVGTFFSYHGNSDSELNRHDSKIKALVRMGYKVDVSDNGHCEVTGRW